MKKVSQFLGRSKTSGHMIPENRDYTVRNQTSDNSLLPLEETKEKKN